MCTRVYYNTATLIALIGPTLVRQRRALDASFTGLYPAAAVTDPRTRPVSQNELKTTGCPGTVIILAPRSDGVAGPRALDGFRVTGKNDRAVSEIPTWTPRSVRIATGPRYRRNFKTENERDGVVTLNKHRVIRTRQNYVFLKTNHNPRTPERSLV